MKGFAQQLIHAYGAGTRVTPTGTLPRSAQDAYAVQSRLLAAFGPAGGFKVGSGPDAQTILAPIMAARCLPSGAQVAVRDRMGIELELGWKITGPLPAPDTPDLGTALACVVVPLPVIELVDARVEGSTATDPWVKLADLQINYGLILGPPLADWDGCDFGVIGGRMQAGSQVLLDGAASIPGGSALRALATCLRAIGAHCGGLQVGQVVITGSLHRLTYFAGGIEVSGRIDGVGSVSVRLE